MSFELTWDAPYTESTLATSEKRWGFKFPPDLRRLFLIGKPVAPGMFDWDVASDENMKNSLVFLAEGFAFDVVYNGFWYERWGERPDISNAPENWNDRRTQKYLEPIVNTIMEHLEVIPRPIPLFGHRYMPSQPNQNGVPILSVHQTDIVHYGRNLRAYFINEFGTDIGAEFGPIETELPYIPFWTDFLHTIETSYEEYSQSVEFLQRLNEFKVFPVKGMKE